MICQSIRPVSFAPNTQIAPYLLLSKYPTKSGNLGQLLKRKRTKVELES
jgi:hypothetical protein